MEQSISRLKTDTFKAVDTMCLVTTPMMLSAPESLCDLLRAPFCLRFCLLLPMGKVVATSLSLTNVFIMI